MKIDLHNHTTKYSPCSVISPDELVRCYLKSGADGLCITEHNRFWNESERSELLEKYGKRIKIFFGAEINTQIGHVLVFSKQTLNMPIDKYVNVEDLSKAFKREESAFIWAHPLRWLNWRPELADYLKFFDAVELYNGNLSESAIKNSEKRFRPFTDKFTGGSDSHSADMTAKYFTQFENSIENTEELIFSIKNGNFRPGTFKF